MFYLRSDQSTSMIIKAVKSIHCHIFLKFVFDFEKRPYGLNEEEWLCKHAWMVWVYCQNSIAGRVLMSPLVQTFASHDYSRVTNSVELNETLFSKQHQDRKETSTKMWFILQSKWKSATKCFRLRLLILSTTIFTYRCCTKVNSDIVDKSR